MKIIGLSENGMILDASKDEVARLIGYYGTYTFRETENMSIDKLVGKEICVSEMYQQLYELQRRHSDIENAKEKLQMCIEQLNLVAPVIDVKVGS